MIIAQKKKKENIIEYILYIWQLEDIIRGFHFDINQIEKNIISKFKVDEDTHQEIKDWYADLIEQMIAERIIKQGHLSFTIEIVEELNQYHKTLLKSKKSLEYEMIYNNQKESINEYRVKSNAPDTSDIEICFNALYAMLLLRLQKKEVFQNTLQAIIGFRGILIFLAKSLEKNK